MTTFTRLADGLIEARDTLAAPADIAALFAAVASPTDVVLLEASDTSSGEHTTSFAVVQASLRVVCRDQRVTVSALTPTGSVAMARLRSQLAGHVSSDASGSDHTAFDFARPVSSDERERLTETSTVEVLRRLQLDTRYRTDQLPFLAGGFAFDYLDTFEDLPSVASGPNGYPDYSFVMAETLLRVDHRAGTMTLTSVGVDEAELGASHRRIRSAADALTDTDATTGVPAPGVADAPCLTARADMDDAAFRRHVGDMQDRIRQGDIYQVVLSRTFSMECPDPWAAYLALRSTNPSPYVYFQRDADFVLLGSSPETNLAFDAETRELQLCPIAGTRARGTDAETDSRAELEMRTDAKEIAEHTMLIDLARNDLARVAVPGTRRVPELLRVDRYSRVMHLVSTVVATLDDGLDALDALRGCMTMGTLTGAPKLRACELLRGVERQRRGSYGGAIGFLAPDGSMDTAIIIRSAYVTDGTALVQAGAGIVRDSIPQAEADETVHKAMAVLAAIASGQGTRLEVVR